MLNHLRKYVQKVKTRLSKGEVEGISGYKQLQMRHFAFEMLILAAVGFQIRLNDYKSD